MISNLGKNLEGSYFCQRVYITTVQKGLQCIKPLLIPQNTLDTSATTVQLFGNTLYFKTLKYPRPWLDKYNEGRRTKASTVLNWCNGSKSLSYLVELSFKGKLLIGVCIIPRTVWWFFGAVMWKPFEIVLDVVQKQGDKMLIWWMWKYELKTKTDEDQNTCKHQKRKMFWIIVVLLFVSNREPLQDTSQRGF